MKFSYIFIWKNVDIKYYSIFVREKLRVLNFIVYSYIEKYER